MKKVVSSAMFFLCSFVVEGQEFKKKKLFFDLHYTTEAQANFSNGKSNWGNLLDLYTVYKPWDNGLFDLETQSIYKTHGDRIADDFQNFSNIDDSNMVINIFKAGYTHAFGKLSLFGGVGNVNHDYFTEEYTSVFANSSCGIYPTIAANYPMPNYPLSGVGIHGEYRFTESVKLRTSFYNGVSRHLFNDDSHSLFAVNPSRDGVFNMTEIGYTNNTKYAFYGLGVASHTSYTSYEDADNPTREHSGYTIWASIEQSVYTSQGKEVGVMFQASIAPKDHVVCKQYFGVGTIWKGFLPFRKDNYVGVFANYCKFGNKTETFFEATLRYIVSRHFSIQPVFSYIVTDGSVNTIGMLRCYVNISR